MNYGSHISMTTVARERLLGGFLIAIFLVCPVQAEVKNGFDLSDSLVPEGEIWRGGVAPDDIAAIDEPKFIPADEAEFLEDDDRVLGISRNGVVKAYPIQILDHHEVVNDRFADEAILVSYCPLCNTGMAFAVQAADTHFTFGVSGLLYNSDVLFFDRQTRSLWSQMMAKAISGPLKGVQMPPVPASHTTWREWWTRHPDTEVLSRKTGYRRSYGQQAYKDYRRGGTLMFPVAEKNRSYGNKELTLGVSLGGSSKAYPFRELLKISGNSMPDNIGGESVTIEWSIEDQSARVLNDEGEELASITAYWFAWFAFHPDTEIFHAAE
jgi:hypothetical protein